MTGSTTHHPPQAGLAGGFDEANSSYHHITFTGEQLLLFPLFISTSMTFLYPLT